MKEKVLIFTDFPIFSNYGGGITTAMNNLSFLLKNKYEIINISKNYYESEINCDFIKYHKYGSTLNLNSVVSTINPKYIYINGLFSFYSSIIPILFFSTNNNFKLILSPRGMLKKSALKKKFILKKCLLLFYKIFSKRIIFHATDSRELFETKKYFEHSNMILIPDLFPNQSVFIHKEKMNGSLNILFASRIDSIKNLKFVLDTLLSISTSNASLIKLTIIGDNNDSSYWYSCKSIIDKLILKGFKIDYLGYLPNNELLKIMNQSHLLFLPSKGENFGYVIAESLSRSLPVLISDQTYFNKNYNLDSLMIFSLNDKINFEKSVLKFINLSSIEFNQISKKLYNSYESVFKIDLIKTQYLQLFK